MRGLIIEHMQTSFGTIDNSAIWDIVRRGSFDSVAVDVRELDGWTAGQKKTLIDRIRLFYGKRPMIIIIATNEPQMTPKAAADYVCDFIDEIGYQNTTLWPIFDDEIHGAERFFAWYNQMRGRKALRQVIWSPEGMQGGWMKSETTKAGENVVKAINADEHILVAAQNYVDTMYPRDPQANMRDLLGAGIKLDRISQVTGMVSSTNPKQPLPLGLDWQGLAYSAEELL